MWGKKDSEVLNFKEAEKIVKENTVYSEDL